MADQFESDYERDCQSTSEPIQAKDELRECPSCGTENELVDCSSCGEKREEDSFADSISDLSTPNLRSAISKIESKIGGEKNLKKIAIGGGIALVAVIIAVLLGTNTICFHDWQEANCNHPKMCSTCLKTEGEKLGHDWSEVTCTEPSTCSRCGVGRAGGEALGHVVSEWTIDREATCVEEGWRHGLCETCETAVMEEIEKLDHTEGEWVITKPAFMGEDGPEQGERSLSCAVCGTTIRTEKYKLTEEEIEAEYKASCQSYGYEEIFRNPDDYKYKKAVFRGKVIQVMEEDGSYTLRVNVTEGRYYWDDTIMVVYEAPAGASRILEDDIVTMYGSLMGIYTYESVIGANITVPLMYAEYIDF